MSAYASSRERPGSAFQFRDFEALGVPPEDFESIAGIAIGYPGERDELPPDLLEKEQPNARKSVREFAFQGRYTSAGRAISSSEQASVK